MTEQYTPQQASEAAKTWCAKHPSWVRICDIPDTSELYIGWEELSKSEQDRWGNEEVYASFAAKRCRVQTGFLSGKGEFFDCVTKIPVGHNLMMVFKVGVKRARRYAQHIN